MAISSSCVSSVKQGATALIHSGQTVSSIKDSFEALSNSASPKEQHQKNVDAGISALQLADAVATTLGKDLPGGNLVAAGSLINNINQINDSLSNNEPVNSKLIYQSYSEINSILASGAFVAAAALGSPVIAGVGAALVIAAGALTVIALAQGDDKVSPEFNAELKKLYDKVQETLGLHPNNASNLNKSIKSYPGYPASIDTRDCHPSNNQFKSAHDLTQQSKSWRPAPSDPFILDLDGDGVETINLTSGILFDHNADGVKTGTGWVTQILGTVYLIDASRFSATLSLWHASHEL